MNKRKRLRRIAILCMHFIRNYAYYSAAYDQNNKLTVQKSQFNLTANGNFLDICILEWCKLFGDNKEQHHWKNIVVDKAAFKARLLVHIGTDSDGLKELWKEIKEYRDNFVAHLDSEEVMHIPNMHMALQAVCFYFNEISCYDTDGSIYNGQLPNINDYYATCLKEGGISYSKKT